MNQTGEESYGKVGAAIARGGNTYRHGELGEVIADEIVDFAPLDELEKYRKTRMFQGLIISIVGLRIRTCLAAPGLSPQKPLEQPILTCGSGIPGESRCGRCDCPGSL